MPRPRAHWQSYVARCGPSGEAWIEAFRSSGADRLLNQTDAALTMLHRKRGETARLALDSVGDALPALAPDIPSIREVLGRFHHGVLAYCFYAAGDLEQAHAELDAADRCVQRAIDLDRCLLPLAYDCHEFRLHHARISRNGRRWDDMRVHVAGVRDVIENRLPLCQLSDGVQVDFDVLAGHYRALPLTVEERRELEPILDLGQRRQLLERFILQMYHLPGFVVAPP
jgi:hypothetical protein